MFVAMKYRYFPPGSFFATPNPSLTCLLPINRPLWIPKRPLECDRRAGLSSWPLRAQGEGPPGSRGFEPEPGVGATLPFPPDPHPPHVLPRGKHLHTICSSQPHHNSGHLCLSWVPKHLQSCAQPTPPASILTEANLTQLLDTALLASSRAQGAPLCWGRDSHVLTQAPNGCVSPRPVSPAPATCSGSASSSQGPSNKTWSSSSGRTPSPPGTAFRMPRIWAPGPAVSVSQPPTVCLSKPPTGLKHHKSRKCVYRRLPSILTVTPMLRSLAH